MVVGCRPIGNPSPLSFPISSSCFAGHLVSTPEVCHCRPEFLARVSPSSRTILGSLVGDASGSEACCSTQLINRDGAFNDAGIEHFIKEVKLAECRLSYAVVSIMGPQSSGKWMPLKEGLKPQGIWMAKCAGIEPCALVMDLEGTDGRERGEVIILASFHSYILPKETDFC